MNALWNFRFLKQVTWSLHLTHGRQTLGTKVLILLSLLYLPGPFIFPLQTRNEVESRARKDREILKWNLGTEAMRFELALYINNRSQWRGILQNERKVLRLIALGFLMDTTLSILALESKHSLDLSVIMSLQRSHHKKKHWGAVFTQVAGTPKD